MPVANLPEMVKPALTGKKQMNALVGPVGVEGESACFKELLVKMGDPPKRRRVRHVPPGINNRIGILGWESDGSVVAMK